MKCLSVQPGQTKHGTVVDHVRVFRNRPDVRWKYRVHEQILPALRATGAEVIFTDIVIQHTGYVDPAFTRQKLERNLRLLHLDHVDHPRDPYILFHLGWAYLELSGSPSPPSPLPPGERGVMQAIAFLRASLDGSRPGDSIVKKVFALLAQAHHRLGQRNEALAACRAGRARYPEDPELLYLEGIFHRERREYTQAIRCLQKLVSRRELVSSQSPVVSSKTPLTPVPSPPEAGGEGRMRDPAREGEAPAEPFGNQAGDRQGSAGTSPSRGSSPFNDPSDTTHHSQLTTHSSNGQFGSSDVGLSGYLARHQLGLVYYQQGRMAEAETEWKLALADRPGYADALKGLGEMYLKQGRYTELDEVMAAMEGEKGRVGDGERTEWVACFRGRNGSSETSNPPQGRESMAPPMNVEGNKEATALRARAWLARKEYEKARSVLEPMVAALPGSVYPRVILSHVYLQEGKELQAAERVLREIVQLDPSQAETWRNLAVLLRQQGRLDEAAEVCRTGWRHCPDHATLPLLLGVTLGDQGNLQAAEMCFLRLLELGYEGPMPDEHVEARHQLALIYQKTGHPAEAEAQWRAVLAERPDHAPAIQALNPPNGFRTPHPNPPPQGGREPETDAPTKRCLTLDASRMLTAVRSRSVESELASIIILCCNQLPYTRQCLESVFHCTLYPYELILVDNGSTDGTREYLRELKTACYQGASGDNRGLKIEDGGSKEEGGSNREVDPRSSILGSHPRRVEIIRNETNVGYPAGCNQALAQSGGRYLVFLNNDVIVTDGWLDGLIAWAVHDKQVGLVGPVTNCASGPQQIVVDYQDLNGLPAFAARLRQEKAGRAYRVDRLTGFCLLVRREVFEQVGNSTSNSA